MKRFALVLLAVLLCVFCFACAAQPQEVNTETGTGVVQTDPYESVGNPVATPAFVFLITVSGVISAAAITVFIRDAKRKTD